MAATNKVKVIDKGWNAIMKNMKQANGFVASVGVQGSEGGEKHSSGRMTNAQLGSIHEYGRGVPQRSHWRSTFDENQAKYQKELDNISRKVYSPQDGTFKGDLLLLGEQYKTDVIRKIHSSIAPDLEEATKIQHKGETVPLLDTGQYIGSFSAVLTDRSSIKGQEASG